ncbi:MAG: ribose 5-phosphate isomerase A [Christensenellaceae bacterium]|jgi:ribose 5-phosphate isomerase A|nr:ribose 5-phosphate isomerase A [Christensenellaceae bacterium]
MDWKKDLFETEWPQEISNYDSKLAAAKKIAGLAQDGEVIGFGSGSTCYLAVLELGKRVAGGLKITAIPTSFEILHLCEALNIPTSNINAQKPKWCFDGADEVDPNGWLIKGRGGAMFNEKLVMINASKRFIVVDSSKLVKTLGTKFAVPVECVPQSLMSVKEKLLMLGAKSVSLRLAGKSKDGPMITENGNLIVDAKFDKIDKTLEKQIKCITGVIESGLFIDYDAEIIRV